jgi:hypothetical protein
VILDIKLDSNHSAIETTIDVYEGNIEDSVLYSTQKTINSSASVKVTLNKKYTVTATYKEQNDYYIFHHFDLFFRIPIFFRSVNTQAGGRLRSTVLASIFSK